MTEYLADSVDLTSYSAMSLPVTLQSASLAQLGSIELHFIDRSWPAKIGRLGTVLGISISMLSNTLGYVASTLQPGCSVCVTRMHLEEWNSELYTCGLSTYVCMCTKPSAKAVLVKAKGFTESEALPD